MKKEKLIEKIDELSSIVEEVGASIKDTKLNLIRIMDIICEFPSDSKDIEDDEDETKPED